MAAISIRGLSKFYPGNTQMAAVSNLSLDIADNQFVTLLGPSGCGKTTTLRLIAGFIKPDAGTIHAGDRLVSQAGSVVAPEHRGMGMVFQNYAVWPHKTVWENVAFGLKIRQRPAAEIKERIARTLALVNLTGYETRYPSQLSGGQQQRVALARSLVVEPGILLLDEPLSNLDAKLRERMRWELKELQRRTGITFVYVTHDQSEAMALSDRIAVMHAGEIMQAGAPREVYARPVNKVVADFMGLVNLVSGRITAVSGDSGRITLAQGLEIQAALPRGLTIGDEIEVAVRPESIELEPAASGSPGATARVIERTFLGNTAEYLVELSGLPPLRVQTHPRHRFAPGDMVALRIDQQELGVFPKGAATTVDEISAKAGAVA